MAGNDLVPTTTRVTKDNFKNTINKEGIVFLDWWAPWCAPCRMFGPIYETVAAKNPDIVFGKIDTQEETELAAANGILSIPTLMILRDGVLLYSEAGAVPQPVLEEMVTKARAIDMAQVHREMAAEEAKSRAAAK